MPSIKEIVLEWQLHFKLCFFQSHSDSLASHSSTSIPSRTAGRRQAVIHWVRTSTAGLQGSHVHGSQPGRDQICGRTCKSWYLGRWRECCPWSGALLIIKTWFHYRLHPRTQSDWFPLSCASLGTRSHHPSPEQALPGALNSSMHSITLFRLEIDGQHRGKHLHLLLESTVEAPALGSYRAEVEK